MTHARDGLQTGFFPDARRQAGAQEATEALLAPLDIRVDGNRPWDIRVHNPEFFTRVLAGGSLALGESYMDGWWSCRALDQFFERILRAGLERRRLPKGHFLWQAVRAKLINAQRPSRAGVIGERHYDIGNRLFTLMLDRRMNYSCAFWEGADTLDQAQENKLDMICRKIGLAPNMRVLDIGCGWGGFAKWAAEKYDARVLGLTVSREQADYARRDCRGLEVTIELQDYRRLEGTFDRIVSIGMLEHVGARNYRTFMQVARRCLAEDGLLLVQTIGGNRSVHGTDAWIEKYIFPNSMLPSVRQIAAASEGLLVLEDWHGFGPDYDRTLMAWHANFTRNWDRIKDRYDERFYRMWTYYLLSCAGSFRARRNQLWQIVFSKRGLRGGYRCRRRSA
jgi:cyclopropane-fatty-acyl-phospholipid synthase